MESKMVFKVFGKRYKVRRGGNLHLALEFGKALTAFGCAIVWAIFFAMLCI